MPVSVISGMINDKLWQDGKVYNHVFFNMNDEYAQNTNNPLINALNRTFPKWKGQFPLHLTDVKYADGPKKGQPLSPDMAVVVPPGAAIGVSFGIACQIGYRCYLKIWPENRLIDAGYCHFNEVKEPPEILPSGWYKMTASPGSDTLADILVTDVKGFEKDHPDVPSDIANNCFILEFIVEPMTSFSDNHRLNLSIEEATIPNVQGKATPIDNASVNLLQIPVSRAHIGEGGEHTLYHPDDPTYEAQSTVGKGISIKYLVLCVESEALQKNFQLEDLADDSGI